MDTNDSTPKKRKRQSVFTEHVPVRMTKEMRERLERRDKHGTVSQAALIRKYLDRGLSRPSDTVTLVVSSPELENLRPVLSRLGVNLNQISRGVNAGKRVYTVGEDGKKKYVNVEWVAENIHQLQKTLNEVKEQLAVIERTSEAEIQKNTKTAQQESERVHHED